MLLLVGLASARMIDANVRGNGKLDRLGREEPVLMLHHARGPLAISEAPHVIGKREPQRLQNAELEIGWMLRLCDEHVRIRRSKVDADQPRFRTLFVPP